MKPNIVRFCIVSATEEGSCMLGEYDMTDWDKGWEVLWKDCEAKVRKSGMDLTTISVLRLDQAVDLYWDLREVLREAKYLTEED
jgi:hypothetical protein